MRRIFDVMERVKGLAVPVVFIGESGTGKDLMARVLHDAGDRSAGPFVPVSCGAMPETLVESTLFGHTRGAFSGADAERPGILATSTGGTLYLDDIGEMPPRMQVDLLRVLQEGCFTPLGSSMSIRTDFRLIASSKVDLRALVDRGLLREDLFYRLQVLTMLLPPLKDRREDIPALARRILARETDRMNVPVRGLSKEGLDALMEHDWPGNIRELEQTIRRAVVVADSSGPLGAAELLGEESGEPMSRRGRPTELLGNEEEKEILRALEECQWNRSEAARRLGIPRRTFYRRLKKMGVLGG